MSDRFVVHNRVGSAGQPVPMDEASFIDIPEEFHGDVGRIQTFSNELMDARSELGRLMQVVNHLMYVCDTAERNLTQAKSGIIDGMGLGDGNWAIDFETKQIGLVLPVQKEMPRVA